MSMVKQYLIELIEDAHKGDREACRILIENGWIDLVSPCREDALRYAEKLKWVIIPQVYATKKPCVRWKVYKDEMRRPTTEELDYWYHHFHFAGIIGLLGPASGLIAIDVDGEAAHVELVRRLGEIPLAPQSWRGKEYRYHLFFGSCEATVGLRRVNGY